MINPNDYDKLAAPVLRRQEHLFVYVLSMLARRIRQIGTLKPSDLYKLERLIDLGEDINNINTKLAEMTRLNIRQINNIIDTVAIDSYKNTKKYFDFRKKIQPDYVSNKELKDTIEAIKKVTTEACYGANPYTGPYMNISGSHAIGIMVQDSNLNKPVFKSVADAYKSVIDYAVQAVQVGVLDYRTTMRQAMTQFVDSGFKQVAWESGYKQRLDTAVKRNILDGVHKVQIATQDIVGQQFGADGKEISVHVNSAPDHEPFQGHQLTNEQWKKLQTKQPFQDVKGNQFPAQVRAIGEMNCKHFAFSIIIGVADPMYTDEELQRYIKDNNKGYTDSKGKHFTLYECTQRQRQMELKIRQQKEQYKEAQIRGDKIKENTYNQMIRKSIQDYFKFSKDCGLRPYQDNFNID